ncbi:stemmadenine O-acetyltransferase-like [Juglans microcarpa x Juglans regia]|uniref:stemmadenine O-acetyltransferase-like n=1 Tax=Juglans microcarpa x Juglans regia TaxID=2249226 RepID=UPI001B7F12FB|nr:stemmadenine O-acetyltransferase-like [Juglans microcarpa x Juglans regia]
MEVEITSKECIKPSSPTPPNLKTQKLSLLDQLMPAVYYPTILFYPMNQSTGCACSDDVEYSQRSQLLKQSLSETLTRFYPFAGKVKDHLSIDCNDEGAYYSEACVNCSLVDCLDQPDLSSFVKFVPLDSTSYRPTTGDHVAMIQVNRFACGGIAIGILVCHMIVDGNTLSVFLKDWAAMACKVDEATCPNFDAQTIFIQNEAFSSAKTAFSNPFVRSSTRRAVTRRIVFDASAIASLKAKATSLSVQNPSRVEVVSAPLGKCTMAAFKATSGMQRPAFISHAVNLRRRAVPPFSESSMGNFVWTVGALCSMDDDEEIDLPSMGRKLREAITKINGDFVKNLQGDDGFPNLSEIMNFKHIAFSNAASTCEMDHVAFTSWCNFGLYDIDFGWGKPMWISHSGTSDDKESWIPNVILLMDTKSGGGIEAWVWLDKKDMLMLAQDNELLAFASLDPSPLN